MLISSILPASTTATAHRTPGAATILPYSSSLPSSDLICLESEIPSRSGGGRWQAAAHTGPARGPLPASSTPTTTAAAEAERSPPPFPRASSRDLSRVRGRHTTPFPGSDLASVLASVLDLTFVAALALVLAVALVLTLVVALILALVSALVLVSALALVSALVMVLVLVLALVLVLVLGPDSAPSFPPWGGGEAARPERRELLLREPSPAHRLARRGADVMPNPPCPGGPARRAAARGRTTAAAAAALTASGEGKARRAAERSMVARGDGSGGGGVAVGMGNGMWQRGRARERSLLFDLRSSPGRRSRPHTSHLHILPIGVAKNDCDDVHRILYRIPKCE